MVLTPNQGECLALRQFGLWLDLAVVVVAVTIAVTIAAAVTAAAASRDAIEAMLDYALRGDRHRVRSSASLSS